MENHEAIPGKTVYYKSRGKVWKCKIDENTSSIDGKMHVGLDHLGKEPAHFYMVEASKLTAASPDESLSDNEKLAVRVLNHVATYDGIIKSEEEIKYMLKQGIEKFISKKRQHLVKITETAYPIKITH